MDRTVVELFAGVGGFRVGLNNIVSFDAKTGRANENGPWDFVWADQWEPGKKNQYAFNCYVTRFGIENSSNEDITLVKKKSIPNHTLLTGGFPCQDYSVARSLNGEKGIEGKKGVLWWQIFDILIAKKPPFVLLENVDRLLKSPAKQRGQAFGIILRCFYEAGYGVQWRVINAADYGHPQRRRRTFIFAFRKNTRYYQEFKDNVNLNNHTDIIINHLMFSEGFPCKIKKGATLKSGDVSRKKFKTLLEVSEKFAFPFSNCGFLMGDRISTIDVVPSKTVVARTLGQCLDENNVPNFCYKVNVSKFRYLKGSKHIERTAKNGHKYIYSEGPIPFPDALSNPGRTMLTSEGTTNRSSHFIEDPVTHEYRILTPVECERLDEFPDNWTNIGMPQKFRYFIAGNALVTGLIRTMGILIGHIIELEP